MQISTLIQIILQKKFKKEDEQILLDSFEVLKSIGEKDLLKNYNEREAIFKYLCVQLRSLFTSVKLKALKVLPLFSKNIEIQVLLDTVKRENLNLYSKTSKRKKMRHSHYPITGVFAHILEDGVIKVRCSAILCIGEIVKQSKEFLQSCRDIIFYMLNDEDDSVRINVIRVLVKMMKKVKGVSSQEILWALFSIQEKNFVLRRELYIFISRIKVNEITDCNLIIGKLMENINVFPEDVLFLFDCFKTFTQKNIQIIETVLGDQLKKDFKLLK